VIGSSNRQISNLRLVRPGEEQGKLCVPPRILSNRSEYFGYDVNPIEYDQFIFPAPAGESDVMKTIGRWRRVASLLLAVSLVAMVSWLIMIRMPGKNFDGPPLPLTAEEELLRSDLQRHVEKLAGEIGERNLAHYPGLVAAADYIENQFTGWKVRRDSYETQGKTCANIEAEKPGHRPGIVLIGAHYDSVFGSPGANDNGTGVAALLALAHRLSRLPNEKTVRLVAFVNEEPGYFQTGGMGSYVYAARCRQRDDPIEAMISLETIGYFSAAADSQHYPAVGLSLIYPRRGNFIAFVSNLSSRDLLRRALGSFRRQARIGSEGGALPSFVPGVGWSDQWSFWEHDYPGIMITDTAPFRYPHYHSATDTPDKIDYDSMTRVVSGIQGMIVDLAEGQPK